MSKQTTRRRRRRRRGSRRRASPRPRSVSWGLPSRERVPKESRSLPSPSFVVHQGGFRVGRRRSSPPPSRTAPTLPARWRRRTRARAPRPGEGEPSTRACFARVSRKSSVSAKHTTRRIHGGGDPRLSRSRGGRHPALASRTRPRGRRRRDIAPTEALERRAPRGAASLAAMPRDALPFRRPSSPAGVGGRARASGPSETCEKTRSGRHGADVATFALQRCPKRAVASGSTPKAAALCGHKASRARGRQRPTPSPSTFRVRRHDDSGPARRVIRARREVRAPAAASAPDPRFLRGDSRCRSTRRGCRPTRRARARRSWRR